jgi:Lrp/AsnC family transcriptional regulator for asnA, asnC and gidA
MKLDALNRRIVESLQRDGRRSFTDIARELGISETAVRARVHRLTDEGVIEILAVTNPMMVGFDVMAMIGVRADGRLRAIADEVGGWDESSYVVILSGSFDLLVEVVCSDRWHLLDLIERLRAVDGVTTTETFTYLSLHKQTFTWGARETG